MPNLQSLRLDWCSDEKYDINGIIDTSKNFSKLKTLKTLYVPDHVIAPLLKMSPGLEEIKIHATHHHTNKPVMAVSDLNLSHLKELRAEDLELSNLSIKDIIAKATNIETIDLKNIRDTVVQNESILPAYQSLKNIAINSFSSAKELLPEILKQAPAVEILSIEDAPAETVYNAKLPNLKIFSLSSPNGNNVDEKSIDAFRLFDMLSHSDKLENLSIKNYNPSPFINDAMIDPHANTTNFLHLTDLGFHHSESDSGNLLMKLILNASNLRSLGLEHEQSSLKNSDILLALPKNLNYFGAKIDSNVINSSFSKLISKGLNQLKALTVNSDIVNDVSETISGSLKQTNLPALNSLTLENMNIDHDSQIKIKNEFPNANLHHMADEPKKNKKFADDLFDDKRMFKAKSNSADLYGMTIPHGKVKHDGLSTLDARTDGLSNYFIFDLEQYFLDKPHQHLNENNYRIEILTDITSDENDKKLVAFEDKLSTIEEIYNVPQYNNLYAKYKKSYENEKGIYFGTKKYDFYSDGWVPLPSLSANEELLGIQSDVPVSVGYCKDRNLYYVKLDTNTGYAPKCDISFIVKSKILNFDTTNIPVDIIKINPYYKNLTFTLDSNRNLKLEFHDDETRQHFTNLSKDRLISELAGFFNSFGSDSLTSNTPSLDNNLLNAIIHDKQGSCRHRAFAFKAIMDQLAPDLHCRISRSDCHESVEIYYEKQWYSVSIGGSLGLVEVQKINQEELDKTVVATAEEETPTFINEMRTDNAGTKKIYKTATVNVDSDNTEDQKIKSDDANDVASINTPVSFDDYISNALLKIENSENVSLNERNLLLFIRSGNDACKINAELMRYLAKNNRRHFYLDSLGDVTKKSIKIEPNGKYEIIDSLLIKYLQQAEPGDVITINWSDFKTSYVGYNTIIDKIRKLGSTYIKPGVIVIGLLENEKAHEMREDFYSRFAVKVEYPKTLSLTNDIYSQRIVEEPSTTPNDQAKVINLYGGDHWKQDLLGVINIDGVELNLKEGSLIKAIKDGVKHIKLVNAPWEDREFQLFWSTCLATKIIPFNDTEYAIPDDLTITRTESACKLGGDYTLETLNPENQSQWEYSLNFSTMSRYFSLYRCKGSAIHNESGLLEKFAMEHPNQVMSILVTSKLSDFEWERFITRANELHVNMRLIVPDYITMPSAMLIRFTAARNTTSSDHANDSKSVNDSIKNDVVFSSDLDYAEAELRKKYHIDTVIPVNEKLGYQDLIESTKVIFSDKDQLPSFTSVNGTMWNDLLKNKTVLLKGKLSHDLAMKIGTLYFQPSIFVY